MSFANIQMKFPFEPGEPIDYPVAGFYYRTTYDKFYIVDANEYISRHEVCYLGIKNAINIEKRLTNGLDSRSSRVTHELGDHDPNKRLRAMSSMGNPTKPPAYFGTWMGKVIPVFTDYTRDPLQCCSRENGWNFNALTNLWSEEFFENHMTFWYEMLLGIEHSKELANFAAVGKTVWVKFDKSETSILWIPTYQELLAQGIPKDEFVSNQMESLSQYISPNDEVESW